MRAAEHLPEAATDRLRLRVASLRSARLQRSPLHAGVAVVYHRVGNPGGDRALELDPALATPLFERQLRLLLQHYRIVQAHELCEQALMRRHGEPFPAALTFDDDLPSHAAVVAPIIRSLAVPATFFLGGSRSTPWWETLQQAVDGRTVEASDLPAVEPELVEAALERRPNAIRRLAAAVEGLDPPRRDALERTLRARAGGDPPEARLQPEHIRELRAAGATIGFHTVGHYDLRTLDDVELQRELTQGRTALSSLAGQQVLSLAYPHGKADARIAQAARDAGFLHGFTGRAAAVRPDDDPLLLGRVQPSFRSVGRFALALVEALVSAS